MDIILINPDRIFTTFLWRYWAFFLASTMTNALEAFSYSRCGNYSQSLPSILKLSCCLLLMSMYMIEKTFAVLAPLCLVCCYLSLQIVGLSDFEHLSPSFLLEFEDYYYPFWHTWHPEYLIYLHVFIFKIWVCNCNFISIQIGETMHKIRTL